MAPPTDFSEPVLQGIADLQQGTSWAMDGNGSDKDAGADQTWCCLSHL